MKKFLPLMAILALLAQQAAAQVASMQLIIAPTPGAVISDYVGGGADKLQLNVNATAAADVYFKISITKTDQSVVVENQTTNYKPPSPVHLNQGLNHYDASNNSVLYAGMSSDNTNVEGLDKNQLLQSQALPEGTYTACVYCYDYNSNTLLNSTCQNFTVQLLQQPIIITPANGSVVTAQTLNQQQPISITWTPVPNAPGVLYDLRLVKVPLNADPQDAMLQADQNALQVLLDQKDLTTPNFFLTPTLGVVLDTGRVYAIQVRAHGTGFNIQNKGLSDVTSFSYVMNPALVGTGATDTTKTAATLFPTNQITCTCKQTVSDQTPISPSGLVAGGSFTMAGHPITIKSIVTGADNTFSGTGTFPFPIMPNATPPILVKFSGVQINASKVAIAGQASDSSMAGVGFLPAAADGGPRFPSSKSELSAFTSWFTSNPWQIPNKIGQTLSPNYALPIGITKTIGGKQQILAITGIRMSPEASVFDASTVIDVFSGSNDAFALNAQNVCFTHTDLCGQGVLYLGQDIDVNLGGKSGIVRMKAPKAGPSSIDTTGGTYAIWNKDGFQSLQVNGQYLFDKSLITTVANNDTVKADLRFKTNNGWEDWYTTLQLPRFKIASGSNDTFIVFNATTATYDHSSLWNPPGIADTFTKGDKSWKGCYIDTLSVTLPQFVKSVKNPGRLNAGIRSLVVDDDGVSASCFASNILSLDNGTLQGWYFSVDTFNLKIFHNSFVSGGLNGRIELPVKSHQANSQGGMQSALAYHCTMSHSADSGFNAQFSVKPENELGFDLLSARAAIAASSSIDISITGSKTKAEAKLDGYITVNSPKLGPIPSVQLDSMSIQGLLLSTEAPYFDPGKVKNSVFGFASPDKKVGGFPLKLDSIKFVSPGGDNNIGLRFAGSLTLFDMDAAPNASTALTIATSLKPGQDGRFVIGTPTASLDNITFNSGNLAGLSINGSVTFYHEDPTFGNGFAGNLGIQVPPGFRVASNFQVGKTTPAGGSGYNYWYFDGKFRFPPGAGIPAFPGTKITGFAGGAYYHMKPSYPIGGVASLALPTQTGSAVDTTSATPSAPGASATGIGYTPDYNTGLGLKARIFMGLLQDNVLNADVGVEFALTNSGGLGFIHLDGHGYLIPSSATASDGLVSADVDVSYDNTERKLDIGVDVHAKGTGYQIDAPFHAYFQDKDKLQWFVKVGHRSDDPDPGNPAQIVMLKAITSTGYLAVGNYHLKGGLPPLPDHIRQILNKANGKETEDEAKSSVDKVDTSSANNGTDMSDYAVAKGIQFGAYTDINFDESFLIFRAKATGGYGFDISLANYPSGCGGQKIGWNNWYAMGKAYAGLDLGLAVHVKLLFIDENIDIIDAGAGALLEGDLPNPTYLHGEIGGYFSVLDDLVSGRFSFKCTIGEKPNCTPGADPLADIKIISSISPDDKEDHIAVDASPVVAFNFKTNHIFTLKQMHDDGSFNLRRFVFSNGLKSNVPMNCIAASLTGNGASVPYTASFTNDNTGMILTPASMLGKTTNYTLNVKCQLYEDLNANTGIYNPNWQLAKMADGTQFKEEKSVTFKTNEGISVIPLKDITDRNPYPDSREYIYGNSPGLNVYFTAKQGINLSSFKNIPGGQPTQTYLRLVNLTDAGTPAVKMDLKDTGPSSKTWATTQTLAGKTSPAKIYAVQYVVQWGQAGNNSAAAVDTASKQVTQTFANGNSMTYTRHSNLASYATAGTGGSSSNAQPVEVVAGKMKLKANEAAILTYYFRTSKYTDMQQKANKLAISKVHFDLGKNSILAGTALDVTPDDYNDPTVLAKLFPGKAVHAGDKVQIDYPSYLELTNDEPFDDYDATWTVFGNGIQDFYCDSLMKRFYAAMGVKATSGGHSMVMMNGGQQVILPPVGIGGHSGAGLTASAYPINTAPPLTDAEKNTGVADNVYGLSATGNTSRGGSNPYAHLGIVLPGTRGTGKKPIATGFLKVEYNFDPGKSGALATVVLNPFTEKIASIVDPATFSTIGQGYDVLMAGFSNLPTGTGALSGGMGGFKNAGMNTTGLNMGSSSFFGGGSSAASGSGISTQTNSLQVFAH